MPARSRRSRGRERPGAAQLHRQVSGAGAGEGRLQAEALGYLTPAAYAANLTAACDRLRNPDQLRRSHVALPAPDGVKPAETLIAAG